MELYRRIRDILHARAAGTKVRQLCVGLGYTAVLLEDGSIGIAYTWFESKTSCSLFEDPQDYEGRPALGLLDKLTGEDLLERSIALAAVNALNQVECGRFADDPGTLLDDLGVGDGSRVSMAGYFEPIARQIEARGASLEVYDIGKRIGSDDAFNAALEQRTDALILSSTSVINGTTEALLGRVKPGAPCALVGPSTPMMPDAFSHLPVTILAGTCPLDPDGVLTAVRHARGTRTLHRSSRKVYWKAR